MDLGRRQAEVAWAVAKQRGWATFIQKFGGGGLVMDRRKGPSENCGGKFHSTVMNGFEGGDLEQWSGPNWEIAGNGAKQTCRAA